MFLELSPTCPLSSSSARLREQGEEAELSVQPVFYEDSSSKIQTVGEAGPGAPPLAAVQFLWQFNLFVEFFGFF